MVGFAVAFEFPLQVMGDAAAAMDEVLEEESVPRGGCRYNACSP